MATQLVEVGTCVVHGLVTVTRIAVTGRPEINTGPCCCTACYVEWIGEHVNKAQTPHLIEINVP